MSPAKQLQARRISALRCSNFALAKAFVEFSCWRFMGPPNVAIPQHLFAGWLDITVCVPPDLGLRVLLEKNGTRAAVIGTLRQLVADHFYDADLLSRLGFEQAADIVRANLPTRKHIRSGDLGEILATEYVTWQTGFFIPLKKLRHKDDRDQPMRGNDVIGLRVLDGAYWVLKGEAKSAVVMDDATVTSACTTLVNDDHRPKASTLVFISRMLRMLGRDAEAEQIDRLQSSPVVFDRVVHLVFSFSGNDPEPMLRPHAGPLAPINDRRLVGLRVNDHQAFIDLVFQRDDAGNP